MVRRWLSVNPMLLAGLEPEVVRALDRRREESLEGHRRIAELTEEARVDPLTGALNRRGIDEHLDMETKRAQRIGDPLAVLVFDLDGLKRTNDDLGHAAGDELLGAVTSAIRAELRATDHLGRIGGDEFLAVLPGANAAQAGEIADRIVEAVRALVIPDIRPRRFDISVGWASTSEGHLASMSLVRTADDRLRTSRQLPEPGGVIEPLPRPAWRETRPHDGELLSITADIGRHNGQFVERRRVEEQVRELDEEIERRVADRTEALAASNKELAAFAYTVSHDLRAPVRVVHSFARILAEDHHDEFSPQAHRHLALISQNAAQMGLLIDGLLAYSRVGRHAVHRTTVDTAQLVRDVVERLRPDIEGRDVELSLGTLPPCRSDPLLLEQVFTNLLSNALKFTRGRAPAVVDVDTRSADETGELVYFVRDNGVGFDMQYADKLFRVFHRLHRADEFEGTGVGLAIVQRIVQRHGGRVIVDAALGEGATIGFTLGAVDDEDCVAATG